jgi:hypothetical protein
MLYVHVCAINDPGHTSDEYLVLFAKSGMTEVVIRAMSTVGTLAKIEESFPSHYFSYLQKYFILISCLCFQFIKSNLNGYLLSFSSLF